MNLSTTECTISVKQIKGIKTIRCKMNGGLKSVGRKLINFYWSQEKADLLMEVGDIIGLGNSIAATQTQRNREPAKKFKSFKEVINYQEGRYRYNYLWNGNHWLVAEQGCIKNYRLTVDITH